MRDNVPRLRLFSGPNGSGKSTLKTLLPSELLGVYLNPDDIEKEMRANGYLDIRKYGVKVSEEAARAFFQNSSFLKETNLGSVAEKISVSDRKLMLSSAEVNSYVASVCANFLREELLRSHASFTLETVMSHRSKVDLLTQAQELGYRTYLYFIATDDPAINVSRVESRVQQGGHSVPEDKIVSRYHASLALLFDAIRRTNRAYILDNSGDGRQKTWLGEVTDGRILEIKSNKAPAWFKRTVLAEFTP